MILNDPPPPIMEISIIFFIFFEPFPNILAKIVEKVFSSILDYTALNSYFWIILAKIFFSSIFPLEDPTIQFNEKLKRFYKRSL